MTLQALAVRFDDTVAKAAAIQERSATLPAGDPQMVPLANETDQLIVTLEQIIRSTEQMKADTDRQFSAKQPKAWIWGKVAVINHQSQWHSAIHAFDMTLIQMRPALTRVQNFRATLAPATADADGSRLCSAGHHNHASRTSCGVCGLVLL